MYVDNQIGFRIVVLRSDTIHTEPTESKSIGKWHQGGWQSRSWLIWLSFCETVVVGWSKSRVVWECSPKSGGKFHLKLNTGERPIAHKYREGKMQRTLKRELKVLEIVEREAFEVPIRSWSYDLATHLVTNSAHSCWGHQVIKVILVAWWTLKTCCVISLQGCFDDLMIKLLTNGCTFVAFGEPASVFLHSDFINLEDRTKLTGHSK